MTQKLTEAEIAELTDGWTEADLAEWGIPFPPPPDWAFRLLNGEYKYVGPGDDPFVIPRSQGL